MVLRDHPIVLTGFSHAGCECRMLLMLARSLVNS